MTHSMNFAFVSISVIIPGSCCISSKYLVVGDGFIFNIGFGDGVLAIAFNNSLALTLSFCCLPFFFDLDANFVDSIAGMDVGESDFISGDE